MTGTIPGPVWVAFRKVRRRRERSAIQLEADLHPEFETTAQGCLIGVLTGRGADIIIDDPLKPEEALSQAQRRAAIEWCDHTLYSRLNDKLLGAIVLIMHRLHESLPSGVTRGTISPVT